MIEKILKTIFEWKARKEGYILQTELFVINALISWQIRIGKLN